MADSSVTIFALDPSTEVTGAVVLWMPERGDPRIIARTAKDARTGRGVLKGDSLAARMSRVIWTRSQLVGFVLRVIAAGYVIDLVAFEADTGRGFSASEALKFATGAYLCQTALHGVRLVSVSRQAACIVAGCLAVYRQPKGKTAKEMAEKRERLKAAVRAWAVREFPELPPDIDDAISDALAVAMYAGLSWRRERMIAAQEAAQRTLKLRAKPQRKGGEA